MWCSVRSVHPTPCWLEPYYGRPVRKIGTHINPEHPSVIFIPRIWGDVRVWFALISDGPPIYQKREVVRRRRVDADPDRRNLIKL